MSLSASLLIGECLCCLYMSNIANMYYTHERQANGTESSIDHFVISKTILGYIKENLVFHNVVNVSNHCTKILRLTYLMRSVAILDIIVQTDIIMLR